MKEQIKQIAACALSFLLLLSTLSVQVDMHFCGDHLVDMAIGGKAATCGMEPGSALASGKCVMASMKCCKDIRIDLHGQQNLHKTLDVSYKLPVMPGLSAAIIWCNPVPKPIESHFTRQFFKDYSPPPLIRRVHLLNEIFLI